MKSELTNREIEALDDIATNLASAREAVEAALLGYRAVLERSRSVRDGIVSRLTTSFERKSERYRDSQGGDEIAHLIASWADLDLDDPDPDLDHHQRIEDLMEGAEITV